MSDEFKKEAEKREATKQDMIVEEMKKYTLRENGCLADIIPTLIEIMGKEQPVEMTGKSLLIKKN